MNIYTYLRIKQAGFADAFEAAYDNANGIDTPEKKQQQTLDWYKNRAGRFENDFNALQGQYNDLEGKNNDLQGRFDTLSGEHSALQGQFDSLQGKQKDLLANNARLQGLVDSGDKERRILVGDRDKLQAQLDERNKYVKDLEDIYNQDTALYTALQDHTKDKDPMRYVQELEKDWGQLDAKAKGRANTIRRQAAEIDAMNNRFTTAQENARRALAVKDEQIANQANTIADNMSSMNRMRRNASIGGAVAGAGLGGTAGYGLANWGGKKMGLTGNKALALNILGATAGAGLGGYGGYRLGQMI